MRFLSVIALALSIAQSSPASDQAAPPLPSGPVLQPADYTPAICDPTAVGFHYVEVRGSGFDAYASQHLIGSVVDASGAPRIQWSNIWVTPQGRLTLEVNLCTDTFQNRPALPPGDYTVSVAQNGGALIATTGISLVSPPAPEQ
jgi:hypothetical protein